MLRQLAGEVVPAVNRLIELGIADPERVCLFGHSRGGYDALALLTQTNLFCAAVVSAGTANLTAIGHGWAEARLQRDGVGAARRVCRELALLLPGSRPDSAAHGACGTASREEEMEARHVFEALRRLGRRVEVRLYQDEDHSPEGWTEASARDLNERFVAWSTPTRRPRADAGKGD